MSTHGLAKPRRIARCRAAALACLLHAACTIGQVPVANPLGSGDSVVLEPAAPPATPHRQRAVYVCQQDGTPVFADRPCGPVVATRNLVVATPPAGAAASTTPPAPHASTRPRQTRAREGAAPADDGASKCAGLRREVEELDDRMRAGYSAREAARLWQRWRDAKERLRKARC